MHLNEIAADPDVLLLDMADYELLKNKNKRTFEEFKQILNNHHEKMVDVLPVILDQKLIIGDYLFIISIVRNGFPYDIS